MKKTFEITIKERYEKKIKVLAESPDDAFELADELVQTHEEIMTDDELTEREILITGYPTAEITAH